MSGYKRILVVDDEEQVVFVLRNSLQKLGSMYEIVTANSGQEALEKVRNGSFDLLITDLRMPGIDGISLTEAVRETDPDTKVIWISAYDHLATDANRLGVYRYVAKPLDVTEIRQIAREGLGIAEPQAGSVVPPASGWQVASPVTTPITENIEPILVMDDDTDLRRLLCKTLDKMGYRTYPACTIQEADQLLHQHRFSILLCDVHMGEERSTDMLKTHLDELKQQGTHVVMISGDSRQRDVCEGMGVEFYIEKPISLMPLVTLIRRLTGATRGGLTV